MIAQRLEDIKIQDAQVIDEKKEEYEQTLDEVIKKNELLSEVIEIIEIEIEDKTNQLEETTQKLIDRDNFIIELQSQVETLTEEIKNKGELIQNSDPDKISENPTLRELIKFYNQQLGRSSSNSANFELSLYLNEWKHQELLKKLKDIIMPILKEITIECLNDFDEPDIMNKFLNTAVTKGTKAFTFENTNSKLDKDHWQQYIKGLINVLPNITDTISIDWFRFSRQEFEHILGSAKHCNSIKFYYCYITTDEECDFKNLLKGATFSTLDFCGTGKSYISNWNNNVRFVNIIKGLGKVPDVVANLKQLNLGSCDISKEFVERTLEDNNFDPENTKVTGYKEINSDNDSDSY